MPSVILKDVFGEFTGDGFEQLLSGVVLSSNVDMEKRIINVNTELSCYVSAETVDNFCKALSSKLNAEIKLNIKYTYSCVSKTAINDIINEIKHKNAVLNGYFNDVKITINDKKIDFELKFGGKSAIENAGFQKQFKAICNERFGFIPEIGFSGQLGEVEMQLPPPPPPSQYDNKSSYNPAQPRYMKRGKVDISVNFDTELLPDTAELLYGRSFSGEVKAMQDVSPDDMTTLCWGDVFSFEMVPTKRGDKQRVNFKFSDGTNSLTAKMLVKNEYSKPLYAIENATIVVKGTYEYDDWEKEYVLTPDSIALATKKPEETDTAEVKRVELHCHTNMSAKDAVSSAADIVRQAYNWGHKAIAITDHGVVQAYPSAAGEVAKIRKKGGEFKVIYGVEAYYIDDTKHDISNMTSKQIAKLRNHQIILVKNLVGLKNLYKLVSEAHINDFHARPITLRSKLDALREGLIIGSACEQGELYKAIVDEKPHEELLEIAKYYDYLEIQPLGNNEFMVRESTAPPKIDKKSGQEIPNRFRKVTSFEVIKNYNRKVVEIADELGKPVVATGDVHFLKKSDDIVRKILMAGQGVDDFDKQAPLYLKTTDEMLADFDYFGDRAKEFVIDNPNKIADMIDDDVIPVPKGNYPPVIEGSDELLRDICWNNAHKIYGENLPEVIEKRLDKELNGIIKNGYSIMYVTAQKLVADSEAHGYLVGSRGSVGSSFVATMAGISEVNPLPPHYVCPECQYNEFFLKGEVGSGFDLPEKDCPKCGARLNRNGHDIPFETFLGFKGDKVPDIDLNFSDEYQAEAQKFTERLFGSENVFKAGTISTIAEKTAFGFAKAYAEKKGIVLSNAELNRLAQKVEKAQIKQTTGQHPAGMIVVPRNKEIYDFCPIQHPADDVNTPIKTTHFDFHSIHDTILKLDELGHVVPTTYKYLEEYSGIKVDTVSMSDPKVYSLFVSTEALGVTPEEIDSKTGTYCLPEFGTKFVREMLIDCQPKNFADLLQISGLSHGTDVWLGNAKDLIDKGICTISEVIGTRDNIMVYLIHKGMEEGLAFKITETVRKGLVASGKVSEEEWQAMTDEMRKVNVPEWYIESCGKIKYMFPKAHAAAYVISALRVAWYKVYRPLEFYCAYFTARPEDVDVMTILKGKDEVRRVMREIKAQGRDATKKDLDVYNTLLIFNEMMSRGIEVLPIDLKHSHAVKFVPEDGKMRLPFGALSGVGEKAAISIYETIQKGNFLSIDDFQLEAKISKTVVETLKEIGAFDDLPESNQMMLF